VEAGSVGQCWRVSDQSPCPASESPPLALGYDRLPRRGRSAADRAGRRHDHRPPPHGRERSTSSPWTTVRIRPSAFQRMTREAIEDDNRRRHAQFDSPKSPTDERCQERRARAGLTAPWPIRLGQAQVVIGRGGYFPAGEALVIDGQLRPLARRMGILAGAFDGLEGFAFFGFNALPVPRRASRRSGGLPGASTPPASPEPHLAVLAARVAREAVAAPGPRVGSLANRAGGRLLHHLAALPGRPLFSVLRVDRARLISSLIGRCSERGWGPDPSLLGSLLPVRRRGLETPGTQGTDRISIHPGNACSASLAGGARPGIALRRCNSL
jgi:hypothetical protein